MNIIWQKLIKNISKNSLCKEKLDKIKNAWNLSKRFIYDIKLALSFSTVLLVHRAIRSQI